MSTVRPYRETDVVLRDGTTVHVRAARPEDAPAVAAFYRSLSPRSRHLRFFSAGFKGLEERTRTECDVDYVNRCTLLATFGPAGEVVGVASYVRTGPDRAEVGFAVSDRFQGRGLGTLLLAHLAQVAAVNGIPTFEGVMLAENYQMLDVLEQSGFPLQLRPTEDEIEFTMPTSFTQEAIARFERREQSAAVAALTAILRPRSVAVIGASRERGTVGGELFRNLLDFGFTGPVFPVNRNAHVVQSVLAYPSIASVPEPVDLAIVVVPAPAVAAVADECGRQGVRALVVISSGFAELGEEGRQRQEELLRVCRRYGMRLVGPNCMGVINTDAGVRLNGTFGPIPPRPGRIGFASQSGALGLAIIDYASTLELGLSSFVSLGNKADISANDLLHYWETDPNTDTILLYVESFGNPRKFGRIARRVARRKPIVATKAGRSPAGARAAASHTGALLAAADVRVDALFRQSGVIRTDTLEEMFDVAALLTHQPLPRGKRVGIVTNVGGPAILAADAAEAAGLQLPVLSEATIAALKSGLLPEATTANPIDLTAPARAEHFEHALRTLIDCGDVDAVVAIYLPPLEGDPEEVARRLVALADSARDAAKPLLAVFMMAGGPPPSLRRAGIPTYTFPEAAVRALARAAEYAEWRRAPEPQPPALPVRRTEAIAIVAQALGRGGGWLELEDTLRLLDCYGIPTAPCRIVNSPEAAAAAATHLGPGPYVVKAVAPGLVHKTEHQAVSVNLRTPDEVEAAAQRMLEQLSAEGLAPIRFAVQPHLTGTEILVGGIFDREFGPLVVTATGGIFAEVFRDLTLRLAPVDADEARRMLRELRGYPLLEGARGRPPADLDALADVIVRLGKLVEDVPEVVEIDLNPVFANPDGAWVADVRARVEPVEPPPPPGVPSDAR